MSRDGSPDGGEARLADAVLPLSGSSAAPAVLTYATCPVYVHGSVRDYSI